MVLSLHGNQKYLSCYYPALLSDNEDIKDAAAEVIRDHGDSSSLPFLLAAFHGGDQGIGLQSVGTAIVAIGDRSVIADLFEIYRTGQSDFRKRVAMHTVWRLLMGEVFDKALKYDNPGDRQTFEDKTTMWLIRNSNGPFRDAEKGAG
jgi:hypothetical protein